MSDYDAKDTIRGLRAALRQMAAMRDHIAAERDEARKERDAMRAAAADREHPMHLAVRMADAYYRENGRGAAELDAATLAWTQAGCPLEVEITAEDMARLTSERDAYKRAKAENDERFMTERDEARRDRDTAQAEVERLTHAAQRYNFWAEVSTDHRSGWCGEHPRRVEAGTAGMVGLDTKDGDDLCLACALLAAWAERDAAAAKERAAVVAWLRLFSPRDSWDGYVPTEVAAAIEAGEHMEATRA